MLIRIVALKCLLPLLFVAIATVNCAGNPNFVKKPKEIQQQVKRVLFLPIYVDKDFFPVLPKEAAEIPEEGYTPEFQKQVKTALAPKLNLIDEIALDALKNGKFKFEVVQAKLNPGLVKSAMSPFYRKKGGEIDLAWPFNKTYSIDPQEVAKLAQTHKVDAVFFHYVQVNKSWYMRSSSKPVSGGTLHTTICLPLDGVLYLPQLYAANGAMLYGGDRIDSQSFNGADIFDNRNGEMIVYLQKGSKGAAGSEGVSRVREEISYVTVLLNKMDNAVLQETLVKYPKQPLQGLVTGD